MSTSLKNFLVSILMVTMMTPFLYLGVAPVEKVEAQTTLGIVMGGVVGVMACYFSDYIEGFFDMLGLTDYFAEDAVPVKETNTEYLDNVEKTAESEAQNIFKECVLDPIIWVIKRLLINFITQAILDWINNGFDNGPVFLTDMGGYFKDIAFTTFNTFLADSGLDQWLCSPFEHDVRLAVYQMGNRQNYGSPQSNYACTLDRYLSNGVEAGYGSMVND